MKRIISHIVPVLIVFFALFYAGCGDKENPSPEEVLPPGEGNTEAIDSVDGATFFQDTLFYYGTNNTAIISYQEQGNTYELEAFEGHAVVFFKEGVNLKTAQNAITGLKGTIIEQIPYIGYYLVRVDAGKEVDFISKITGKNVEYASLDLVATPCSVAAAVPTTTHILDAYFPGELHGLQVQSVYNGCSGKISYLQNFGFRASNGKTGIKSGDAMNAIIKNRPTDQLYNLSFGPALNPYNDGMQWSQASAVQRNSYVKAYQTQIRYIILKLKGLRRAGNGNLVITMAAGNEGLANFDEVVLTPMLNGTAGINSLSDAEKQILQDNILIVSSLESTSNSMKYHNNAMGKVDTQNLTYNGEKLHGTSFAAPQALCDVRKLMGDMGGVTAVAALAAIKKAIQNNPYGTLDYGEALAQAQQLYNAPTAAIIKGSKWNLTTKGSSNQVINTTLFFDATGNCEIGWDFYIGNNNFSQGTYKIYGNRIIALLNTTSNTDINDESYVQFDGTVNGDEITGTYTGKYEYGSTDIHTGKITIQGYTSVSQPFQCKRTY